jgi:hypothetical protein
MAREIIGDSPRSRMKDVIRFEAVLASRGDDRSYSWEDEYKYTKSQDKLAARQLRRANRRWWQFWR